MNIIRRHASSITGAVLVALVGAGALHITQAAHDSAHEVHADDRVTLQHTLAGLTSQYLLFTAAEALDAASTPGWSLTPGDPADTARLEDFVSRAQLVNHGAALVDLSGKPFNQWSHDPGLPAPDDPGYGPVRTALLAGDPGISSVMDVDGVPVFAVAVPVTVDGALRALLVAHTRADTSPLHEYASQIEFGETGVSYVVDSDGTIVAGGDGTMIGKDLASPGTVTDGGEGFTTFDRDGTSIAASHSPADLAGWTTVIEQDEAEFFSELDTGRTESLIALGALLAAAMIGMAWLARKRRLALDRVEYQAFHDPLTDLANRGAFRLRLEGAMARARRSGDPLAVLFVDLDQFKTLNDRHGHEAGDTVLCEAADRIRSCVREVDLVARMGGDEFTVVLEGLGDPSEATVIAERISRALEAPLHVAGERVMVPGSVGVALSDGNDSADAVVRDADLAMYFAKDSGGARHAMFQHGQVVPTPVPTSS